ncbi:hypothetical protein AX17_003854 [Amanita inopinata Kibby_2008]|nr:hypothetical protein AX17_003854 [Amanita inopinata Kibby_2008]
MSKLQQEWYSVDDCEIEADVTLRSCDGKLFGPLSCAARPAAIGTRPKSISPCSSSTTVGPDGYDIGMAASQDAIAQLYQLLRNLESGVNLLIYCMRASRIKDSGHQNWRLFLEVIYQGRVPIVLVITGLEGEENMDDWWRRERNGGGHIYDEEYEESREKIRTLLQENFLVNAWKVPPGRATQDLTSQCGMSKEEAHRLAERLKET